MKCLNQIFRPKIGSITPDHGDCTICTANLDNKKCKGYQLANIKIHLFEVEENDPKKSSSE